MADNNVWEFLGPMSRSSPAPKPEPPPPVVAWDDIVGQTDAKAAVREAIEGATKNAALYKKYRRRPTKGVLLFGPPGNGKTMLGKAGASAMAAQHGQAARKSGFIYVKGPEVLDQYLGQTERKIRDLFARAREHKSRHGYPAVIFIDEAESILNHRSEHSMSRTIVPTFLAEMDGMDEMCAVVLIATNRPSTIDSAVLREGRVDRKVLVARPSREDAVKLLATALRDRPVNGDIAEMAEAAVDFLFDTKHVLYRAVLEGGKKKDLTLGDFTSCAQVAFLVDAAASVAIDREVSGGEEGIRGADFAAVIRQTLKEQREVEHPTELEILCEPFVRSIVDIERVRGDGSVAKRSLIAEVPKGVELKVVGNQQC